MIRRWAPGLGLVWAGCSGGADKGDGGSDTPAVDSPADTDTDTDADTDADTDTDSDTDTDTDTEPTGLPVLGGGSHDVADVVVTVVLDAGDGLLWPTDVAFHPDDPEQLWITNRGDDTMVLVDDPAGAAVVDLRHDPVTSNHFLAKPSSLAFGAPGVLGTIHDEHERTQGPFGTPPDFMGPTLWSADPAIFDAGDPSHLDMLHNSPDGVGIAWAGDHVYWVFDGTHGSLTRYDFGQPHELGGTYHGDGIIQRWVEGEVARGPDSVGHLAYDDASGFLYVADTGHARLARLDTASGQEGRLYGPAYDTPDQYKWDDAVLDTLVDGSAIGLEAPAGLELSGGLLWVTDAATATIWAFDLSGNAVDWLPTGRTAGALQGLTLDANGDLWVVDARAGELLHVAPR